jgi:hypothetical protein
VICVPLSTNSRNSGIAAKYGMLASVIFVPANQSDFTDRNSLKWNGLEVKRARICHERDRARSRAIRRELPEPERTHKFLSFAFINDKEAIRLHLQLFRQPLPKSGFIVTRPHGLFLVNSNIISWEAVERISRQLLQGEAAVLKIVGDIRNILLRDEPLHEGIVHAA